MSGYKSPYTGRIMKKKVFPLNRRIGAFIQSRLRQKAFWIAWTQIILGCLAGAAAYPLFLTPNHIAPGGLTGVGLILNSLWDWRVGTVSLICNIPLFIIGYRTMGRIFAFRSLVATMLFSLMIDMIPLPPMTEDPLLSTLFGGVLLGIGLGLILRGGATTGGTDMAAKMVHRRLQFISTGTVLFLIDFLVVTASGIAVGTTAALYALINIYVSARVIDVVVMGFSGDKACLIISPAWETIMNRIMKEMNRGVTLLSARGGYTGTDRPTIYCVISRPEIMAIKKIVREEDESAFMTIMDAVETIGDGFSGIHDNES